jgi:deoxyinosine 3'endonuclease (endonuclease V)
MILAFDTYYYDGYSYTVCGAFESWDSEKAKFFVSNRRKGIDAEYTPGELYKRELPCIMQCLSHIKIDNVTSMVVDGFAWVVDEEGNQVPGLGKRLQDAVLKEYGKNISVVGIAKNPYHKQIPNCEEVYRGISKKPLYVTCTENAFVNRYAINVELMFGEFRIPDIIKSIDTKTKSYCASVEDEPSTVRQLIESVNNDNNKKVTLGELAGDMADFDQWAAEVKERGFSYEDAT